MHPVALEIGGTTIYTYSLVVALAFLLGTGLFMRRAQKHGLSPRIALDLGLVTAISALLGAQALYFLIRTVHLGELCGHFQGFDLIDPSGTNPAGSVLGGVILSLISALIFTRCLRISFVAYADLAVPCVAFGEGVGRIGCFLAGCCFGKPAGAPPWAVSFPPNSKPWMVFGDEHLHPSQLYATIFAFGAALILLRISKTSRYPGETFCWYLVLRGFSRTVIDTTRHYSDFQILWSWELLQLSVYQVIALAMAVAGIAGLSFLRTSQRMSPGR